MNAGWFERAKRALEAAIKTLETCECPVYHRTVGHLREAIAAVDAVLESNSYRGEVARRAMQKAATEAMVASGVVYTEAARAEAIELKRMADVMFGYRVKTVHTGSKPFVSLYNGTCVDMPSDDCARCFEVGSCPKECGGTDAIYEGFEKPATINPEPLPELTQAVTAEGDSQ